MQLHALGTLFKVLYTLVYAHFYLCRQKFPRKSCRQIDGKYTASVWRNLSTVTAPKFVGKILCCVALVYSSYFFQDSRFTEIIRH